MSLYSEYISTPNVKNLVDQETPPILYALNVIGNQPSGGTAYLGSDDPKFINKS